jgi:hypothetical protein
MNNEDSSVELEGAGVQERGAAASQGFSPRQTVPNTVAKLRAMTTIITNIIGLASASSQAM